MSQKSLKSALSLVEKNTKALNQNVIDSASPTGIQMNSQFTQQPWESGTFCKPRRNRSKEFGREDLKRPKIKHCLIILPEGKDSSQTCKLMWIKIKELDGINNLQPNNSKLIKYDANFAMNYWVRIETENSPPHGSVWARSPSILFLYASARPGLRRRERVVHVTGQR